MARTKYYYGGNTPEVYMSDYHFLRDLDPWEYPGGDHTLDMSKILKWRDLYGG